MRTLTRKNRTPECRFIALAIAALAAPASVLVAYPSSSSSSAYWIGGSGNWSDASRWRSSTGLPVPGLPAPSTDVKVFVDAGNATASIVFLDMDAVIASLALDMNDRVVIQDGRSLAVGSSAIGLATSITNHGVLRIEGVTQNAILAITSSQPVHITGTGEIELVHPTCSRVVAGNGSGALVNTAATMRGAGIIGDETLCVINAGLIQADVLFEPLTISPNSSGLTNTGILQSLEGGILRLRGTCWNETGIIRAWHGSHIEIDEATIIGGSLATTGTGIIRCHQSPATLDGVRLDGRFELGLTRLTLRRTVTNNGSLDVLAASSVAPTMEFSEIVVPAGDMDVMLDGNGTLNLNWTKIHAGDAPVGGRLVNGHDHTIYGEGLVGMNSIGLINHGTIVADRDNPLVIDPWPIDEVINTGTMIASGSGGLVLTDGSFRNDGVIEVQSGSKCMFTSTAVENNVTGGTLVCGTWRVIGGDLPAKLIIPAAAVTFNNADVTLSGPNSVFALMNALTFNFGRFAIMKGRNFTPQGLFFQNDGELFIGVGSRMNGNGEYHQTPSATLHLEIGSVPRESWVTPLTASVAAVIGGTLRLTVADDAVIKTGDQFELLAASSILGTFGAISAPPGIHVEYRAGAVLVHVTTSCPGDIDFSGGVDTNDLLMLIGLWGDCDAPPAPCTADLNVDGTVDVNDLLLLIAAWGACP